jgi:hypothetical protein
MKTLAVLVAFAVLAPTAGARVWTTVYYCDGVTPFPALDPNHPTTYGDIMVGTRLVIVVSSDKSEAWQGSLQLSQDDAQYAQLSGRDYVKTPPNYKGSCLPAAGRFACVRTFQDAHKVGMDLYTSPAPVVLPGDWFVVDYRAERVGSCRVGLYNMSLGGDALLETLSFTHVPSRDFNGDTIVDFKDLVLLAAHWDCPVDPEGRETAFDLNGDGRVDLADLALFSVHWLERTDSANASQ